MSEEAAQGQGWLLLSNSRFAGDEGDIGGGMWVMWAIKVHGLEGLVRGVAKWILETARKRDWQKEQCPSPREEEETVRCGPGKGPAPLRLIRGLLCWQAHCVPARFPFLNTVTSAIHGAPFRDMHLAGREGTVTLLIFLIVRSPPLQLLQARHLVVRHGVASC